MSAGVYLIRADNGLYKIGQTVNIERRLAALRRMSAVGLVLVHMIQTTDPHHVEAALHAQFKHCRVVGEWFRLSAGDVAVITAPTYAVARRAPRRRTWELLPISAEPTRMTAQELRQRREALGLSVGELAREFDVENSTLYRWEASERPLRGVTAIGVDAVLRRLEREQRREMGGGEAC